MPSQTMPDVAAFGQLADLCYQPDDVATERLKKVATDDGQDVTQLNQEGKSLLFVCAAIERPQTIQYLIESKCDPNLRDITHFRQTPLHYASSHGSLESIKVLISSNAQVDVLDVYKQTPLFWAASNGKLEACKLLLEHGANKHLKDNRSAYPATWALKKGHTEVAEFLKVSEKPTPPGSTINVGSEGSSASAIARAEALANKKEKIGRFRARVAGTRGRGSRGGAMKKAKDSAPTNVDESERRHRYRIMVVDEAVPVGFVDAPEPLLAALERERPGIAAWRSWVVPALRLLNCVEKYEEAWPFLKPVDAEMYGCLDYYDVVKEPMDFGTIRNKLCEHKYSSADDFAADIRLIFSNCKLYNEEDTAVFKMGQATQAYIRQQIVVLGLNRFYGNGITESEPSQVAESMSLDGSPPASSRVLGVQTQYELPELSGNYKTAVEALFTNDPVYPSLISGAIMWVSFGASIALVTFMLGASYFHHKKIGIFLATYAILLGFVHFIFSIIYLVQAGEWKQFNNNAALITVVITEIGVNDNNADFVAYWEDVEAAYTVTGVLLLMTCLLLWFLVVPTYILYYYRVKGVVSHVPKMTKKPSMHDVQMQRLSRQFTGSSGIPPYKPSYSNTSYPPTQYSNPYHYPEGSSGSFSSPVTLTPPSNPPSRQNTLSPEHTTHAPPQRSVTFGSPMYKSYYQESPVPSRGQSQYEMQDFNPSEAQAQRQWSMSSQPRPVAARQWSGGYGNNSNRQLRPQSTSSSLGSVVYNKPGDRFQTQPYTQHQYAPNPSTSYAPRSSYTHY